LRSARIPSLRSSKEHDTMSHDARLDYRAAAPASMQALLAFAKGAAPSLDLRLRELVNLRVSQVNGCAFCMDMHAAALVRMGVEARVLHVVAGWREAQRLFSPRERAALAWAEAVNAVPQRSPSDEEFRALREQFKDAEIAELTFAVCAIRSFNMLNASFRTPVPPTPYVAAE
jgi:AhpD family alkylhydroperoxidase